MPVKHKTLPAGTDRPGFAGVTPSLYAQEHLYSGGAHGSILTRNTLNSDGAGWVQSLAGVFISTGTDLLPAFSTTLPNAVQDNITRTGIVTSGTWSALFGAVTGANLTNLTAGNLTGTITNSVQDNITRTGTVTSGTWSASFGAVSGANLTTLNATNISSGTLADTRLSSNIPLKNALNAFTAAGLQTFSASTNASHGLSVTNSNSSTAAAALLSLTNNTPTDGILMQASSGYTAITAYGNTFTALRGLGAGGIIFGAEHASGAFKFFTQGTAAANNTANLTGGTTGAVNFEVKQLTAGTGNFSRLTLTNDVDTLGRLTAYSSTFTTSGAAIANTTLLHSQGRLHLNSGPSGSANVLYFYTGDVLRWGINAAGDTIFGASAHIVDGQATPTIASGGGTSPSISGNAYAFKVTIGTGGVATGVTINFNVTYSSVPVVVVTPATGTAFWIAPSTTQLSITSPAAASPLTVGETFHVLVRGF